MIAVEFKKDGLIFTKIVPTLRGNNVAKTKKVVVETGPLRDNDFGDILRILSREDGEEILMERNQHRNLPKRVSETLKMVKDVRAAQQPPLVTQDPPCGLEALFETPESKINRATFGTTVSFDEVASVVRLLKSGKTLSVDTIAYMLGIPRKESKRLLENLIEVFPGQIIKMESSCGYTLIYKPSVERGLNLYGDRETAVG